MIDIELPLLAAFSLAIACHGASAATQSSLIVTPVGSALEIPATLVRPDGEGPFPALVIMHDCSGLGAYSSGAPARWAAELVSQGYVVLIPDSFTPRGFPDGVCAVPGSQSASANGYVRAADAYGALAALRALRFVDGKRVGVMGGSHGGWTVLAAMFAPREDGNALADAKREGFAAAVALYPGCAPRYGDWSTAREKGTSFGPAVTFTGTYRPIAPLLILIGERDDWTPAEPCRRLAESSRTERYPVEIKVRPCSSLRDWPGGVPAEQAEWRGECAPVADRGVARTAPLPETIESDPFTHHLPPRYFMERAAAFLVLAFAVTHAFAADYPAKPIRIISPFPPGGSVDLVARLVGTDLGKQLGQQVVVDNRSGASGMIGTELAAKAPPDGYTLVVNTLPFVTNQFAYSKVPYDPVNDFAPISILTSVASVLVSHPALPVNSMKDLIALARAKPGAITYGTAGAGTNPHIAGELLNNLAKIKLVAVHYKGGGPAQIATLSGEVQLYFVNAIPEALPHIQAKKLKAIGITAAKRNPGAPQIPTMAEAGLPGYEFTTWQILAAPKGTPAPIIATLNEKVRAVMKTTDAVKRWQERGFDVVANTPEEAAAHLASEIKKWRVVFKEQNIKAE